MQATGVFCAVDGLRFWHSPFQLYRSFLRGEIALLPAAGYPAIPDTYLLNSFLPYHLQVLLMVKIPPICGSPVRSSYPFPVPFLQRNHRPCLFPFQTLLVNMYS